MEWKAFAAASYVDPNPRSLFCFENFGVLVLNFSGACLLVSKPLCRRFEDAEGRFSPASAQ